MKSPPLLQSIQRLYGHLSRRRRTQLAGLLGLMLVGAVAELVTIGAVLPFLALMADSGKALEYPFLQRLFSMLGWQDMHSILLPATLLFATVAVASGAIRMLLFWVSSKVTYGIGYDLGVEVYRRTLFQPYRYHVARNTSQIIGGMNKVEVVMAALLTPLMASIIAALTSTAILVALILIDPVVASIAGIGFTVLYLLITLTTRHRVRKNSQIISQVHSTRVQAVQEGLGGIRDVLIDGSQGVYVDRFRRIDAALRKAQVVNTVIATAPRYLIEAVGMVLIAGLAYWLSLREGGLIAAIPVLGALAIGAQKLLPLMQQVYNGWASIMGNTGVINDVVDLIEQPIPGEYLDSAPLERLPFKQSITLQDINFRYAQKSENVLKALSLNIAKGSRVGFIGKTGSGKSTALDLMMGLLEPTDGRILIDGLPLTSSNRRNWQARIAHVPQTIYLSDATVAENIAFGIEKLDIDYDRVREAARKAHIAGHIEALPKQYETEVGERGVRLSGGQRQRIGIARALYKQADVLIFDEATSALDDTTEHSVMEAIRDLGPELTVMLIAHRLSTLSACDFIFELSAGQLLRQGNYRQIIGSPNSLG
jgi:ABC-type multidrug transport system fused ATPase/permease subunit